MSLPNRRTSITEEVGPFAVTVSFDQTGRAVEVFMSKRAKPGTELDSILYDLGVTASKLIQKEGL